MWVLNIMWNGPYNLKQFHIILDYYWCELKSWAIHYVFRDVFRRIKNAMIYIGVCVHDRCDTYAAIRVPIIFLGPLLTNNLYILFFFYNFSRNMIYLVNIWAQWCGIFILNYFYFLNYKMSDVPGGHIMYAAF